MSFDPENVERFDFDNDFPAELDTKCVQARDYDQLLTLYRSACESLTAANILIGEPRLLNSAPLFGVE